LGAAKGLAKQNEGIVLILGTGSNSGFYDGEKIVEQVSSLGYLLGDEGSGSRIGRKLLADFFRNKMPIELAKEFALSFQLSTSSELLKVIFQQHHQGKYLASFAKFALENKDNKYIKMLIQREFNLLFEEVIMAYNKTAHCIYATGSIAFYFENELQQAAENFNYKIALIKQSPIVGLAEYFSKYETNG
jgi:N-acetylglucosamine kinase-like BadF-type ATPase